MADILKGHDNGLPSASLLQSWITDHARGRYSEVARAWGQVRDSVPAASWATDGHVVEAIGWSLALTKNWEGYALFRSDLRPHTQHADLIALLDAWRAIHEARYDVALHGARAMRSELLGSGHAGRA